MPPLTRLLPPPKLLRLRLTLLTRWSMLLPTRALRSTRLPMRALPMPLPRRRKPLLRRSKRLL